MQAAILSGTLAALTACVMPEGRAPEGEPIPTALAGPPRRAADCERYRDLPDVRGYCLMKVAATGQGPEDALQVCGDAGIWESDCRQAWSTSRARGGMTDRHGRWHPSPWTTMDLLTGCGENDDCRFAILDTRPDDDVVQQARLCVEHGGKYRNDCVSHALDRWMRTLPTPEELHRVSSAPNDNPVELGRYLAISVACLEVGGCTGPDDVREACEKSVLSIQADAPFCEDWRTRGPTPLPTTQPGRGIR